MTFGLIGWLRSKYSDLNFEIPIWYPSREQADQREWLVTNGLGGYSAGTVCGSHTRRYHGLLVAALSPPRDRHHILSRVDEIVKIDGKEYQLATNHWASGVVSPTGFKFIESFTTLPQPTWVYELDGHYLIKQICLNWGTNEVYVGYHWLPDQENLPARARIRVRFLAGFRNFHSETRGSSDDRYPQFVSPNHSVVILNESERRLCMAWNRGDYKTEKQWWWDFQWPEESARNLPDTEDLYLVGSLGAQLIEEQELSISASLDRPAKIADCHKAVELVLKRQRQLLRQANLPRTESANVLTLACDQFLVQAPAEPEHALRQHPLQPSGKKASPTPRDIEEQNIQAAKNDIGSLLEETSVIEGYPWFNESGRVAMVSLPGLTLSTRRFDEAKKILTSYANRMINGLMPNRVIEHATEVEKNRTEYGAADVTLWWGWSIHQYFKATKDKEFVRSQLPKLHDAAGHYIRGTSSGIRVDSRDGLLQCANARHEYTWMDTTVAEIPITPRSGKAVEICALWYNFLEAISFLSESVDYKTDSTPELKSIAELCRRSMQKFWNNETLCLYDVIEPATGSHRQPDTSVRPNQILAISLPFRCLDKNQEKLVLTAVEAELFTPFGLRTLSPSDPSYQSTYGCGFPHADQYHRDLSYHQGTVWPWLLGPYCDSLVNVYGAGVETKTRISLVVQPLLKHMLEDVCLGSISEIFDGANPHTAHGAIASAWSVAEAMRWYSWQSKN
jgi:4-alpha-glucanotransferase